MSSASSKVFLEKHKSLRDMMRKTPSTTSPSGIRHLLLVEQSRLCTLRNTTTWRTGTDDRLLTLYQGTSKNTVDGYFYNSKSGRIEGRMVRSTYRNSNLTDTGFQAKNTKKCASMKYGTFHWGKFLLNITKTSFKGQWSYCDEAFRRKLEMVATDQHRFFWRGGSRQSNPDKGLILMHCFNCGSPIW